jgi:hypothetical protein
MRKTMELLLLIIVIILLLGRFPGVFLFLLILYLLSHAH